MKFKTIQSLGSRCQNSEVLKHFGYREFSGFFDFMNTQTIDVVNHIIHDDFNEILKKENNHALICNQMTIDPETGQRLYVSTRTANSFYNTDVTDVHAAIFPHHDLTNEDYNHFLNCKQRFKKLINYNVLFNYSFNIWENNISLGDIKTMVKSLKEIHNFKNFKVCFIGITRGVNLGYKRIDSNEFYDVWELIIHPSSYTGGLFTDTLSNQNYINIIKSYDIAETRVSKEEIDSTSETI